MLQIGVAVGNGEVHRVNWLGGVALGLGRCGWEGLEMRNWGLRRGRDPVQGGDGGPGSLPGVIEIGM